MSSSLHDFDYNLPKNLIASSPVEPRDSSRLLIYKKSEDKIIEDKFYNVAKYLPNKTVLVFNNSKVFKARLVFEFNSKKLEIFFAEKIDDYQFVCLVKPGKFFKVGLELLLPGGVKISIKEVLEDGSRIIQVLNRDFDLFSYLNEYGETPLPPYIETTNPNQFFDRYQTVYAKNYGSTAAPTAGLHFTDKLINDLKDEGIKFVEVTLNVGLGTFKPVTVENIKDHKMHSESFEFSENSANTLNKYLSEGYSIIPVGTTSIRVLQTCFDKNSNKFQSKSDNTDIFIYPGYSDWIISGMITNFHLPKSTLLMLISAFLGLENAKKIYNFAVEKKYRFFSFGDACLFLD